MVTLEDPPATTADQSAGAQDDLQTKSTLQQDAHGAAPLDAAPAVKPPGATDNGQSTTKESSDSSAPGSGAATNPPTTNTTGATSIDIDPAKLEDFDGEVATTNDIPSTETIKKLENYILLDRHGKTHTFKSLYTGRNVARRVMVIFVRHFFCGNCVEFVRTLADSITPPALLSLRVSTFILVIGCGSPDLIKMYAETTNCPFPIYTDPTSRLYQALGMTRTWDMGAKPAYLRKSMFKVVSESVSQALKHVTSGLATKSGDHKQVGGEFLFEPVDITTPIMTPEHEHEHERQDQALDLAIAKQEQQRRSGSLSGGDNEEEDSCFIEEKRVTWCHRMRTTRDHVEIPELMEVLGLDGNGKPTDDLKRWARALQERKGTGLSMASQMSKMSQTNKS